MFKHGADLEKIKRKYHIKGELVDFSSNINPFSPENMVLNIIENIDSLKKYPDIEYLDLRREIAMHIASDNKSDFIYEEENVCVGNGSTELIYLLLRVIEGKIGIICPTFSEYRRAARILGKDHTEIQLEKKDDCFDYPDFNEPEMQKYKDLSALIICNPNNPDGKLRNIDNIVNFCEKNNIKLVVDETFIEFSNEYREYTASNYEYEEIYVIRAITKLYGIPGIRLGYLVSKNKAMIDEMLKIKLPWTVNSIAVSLGMEIFKDNKFREMTRKFYLEERSFMLNELRKIDNLTVYDSDSAFLLIKINDDFDITAGELKDKLIFEYGILIRDASNFLGLDEKYFRVAIKRRNDNMVLIEGLKEIFN